MAKFKTQTNEIHLLKNSTHILNANTFQLKVRTIKGEDITHSPDISYSVFSGTDNIIEIDGDLGLICVSGAPNATVGTDYVLISNSNSSLLIKVTVHQDIKITNDNYVIFSGNKRITFYSSKVSDNRFFYYTPTIYAEFDDGSFGDISNHPFLHYIETELDQTPTITSNILEFETVNNLHTGRIYCKAKGDDDPLNNDPFQTHRNIQVSLHGETSTIITNTKIFIPVRCERDIYQLNDENLILLNRGEVDENFPITRVLLLGEGFKLEEKGKFTKACKSYLDEMRYRMPYKLLSSNIEFWYAFLPSAESGITTSSYLNITIEDQKEVQTLVPLDFNYFKTFSAIIKKCIIEYGLYDGISTTNASNFFDNNKDTFGFGINDKADFISKYKKTQPNTIIEAIDSSIGLQFGGENVNVRYSRNKTIETENEFWLQNTDYYHISQNSRMHNYELGQGPNKEIKSFINELLISLKSTDGKMSGSVWLDRNQKLDTNFFSCIVNNPVKMGVNIGKYFISTIGNSSKFKFKVDDLIPLMYKQKMDEIPVNENWDTWDIPLSMVSTFIHEFTHFIDILDEYEDVRGESKNKLSPDKSDYFDIQSSPNIDTFNNISNTNDSTYKINPLNIKWDHPSIGLSLLCYFSESTLNSESQLEVEFKKEKSKIKYNQIKEKINRIKEDSIPVQIRSMQYNSISGYSEIGGDELGSIIIKEVNFEENKLILEFDSNTDKHPKINYKLGKLKNWACLYTIKNEYNTVKSINIKEGFRGFGFKDKVKGKTIDVEIKDKQNNKNSGTGVLCKLKIDQNGSAKSIHISTRENSLYRTDNPSDLYVDLNNNLFDKSECVKPEFEIILNPIYSSIKMVVLTNPGSGYETPPDVKINNQDIYNGASYEAKLSEEGYLYADIDPENDGGEFLMPVFAKLIDKRGISKAKKLQKTRSIITELDSNKRIMGMYLFDLDNIKITNANSNDFEVKLFSNNNEIPLDIEPNLSFNSDHYNEIFEGYVSFRSGGMITDYEAIAYNSNFHSEIDIPRIPIGVRICPKGSYSDSPSESALDILLYLNNDGEVSKIEILSKGKNFVINDEYNLSALEHEIKNDHSMDTRKHTKVAGGIGSLFYYHNKSYGSVLNFKPVAYFQKRIKNYYEEDKVDDLYKHIAINTYLGKDNTFKWPVIKILSVHNGGVEQIGFKKVGDVLQKGNNLRYPISGPIVYVMENNMPYSENIYIDFQYENIPNSYKVKIKGFERPKDKPFKQDAVFRILGGKYEVVEPSAIPESSGDPNMPNFAVPCDITANSGGAQARLKIGKSIKEIVPKTDSNGKLMIGENILTAPNIQIGPHTISNGTQATAKALLSNNKSLIETTIMNIMLKEELPLIPSLHKNDKDNSHVLDKDNAYFQTIMSDLGIPSSTDIENDNRFKDGTTENNNALLTLLKKKIKTYNSNNNIEKGDLILNLDSLTLHNITAIFEGGGTYDFNAFRSSLNSLMRHHYDFLSQKDQNDDFLLRLYFEKGNLQFNPLTMYHIINYLDPSKLSELEDFFSKTLKYITKK